MAGDIRSETGTLRRGPVGGVDRMIVFILSSHTTFDHFGRIGDGIAPIGPSRMCYRCHDASVAGTVSFTLPAPSIRFLERIDELIGLEHLPDPMTCCASEAKDDANAQGLDHRLMNRPARMKQTCLFRFEGRFVS